MVSREDIVAEALSWKGTPFHWQQMRKGAGCDCKGLVAGVAQELGMPEAKSIYAAMPADASGRVDTRLLIHGLEETMVRADRMQPGDVLLLTMAKKPQHLAILIHDRIVHTYGHGPDCVITTPLSVALRAWPLNSIWTWKSLDGN